MNCRQIAIYRVEQAVRSVLIDEEPLEQLTCDPDQINRLDVFLGKIERVVPALDAVFVEIGDRQAAFLSAKGADLKAGQPILVQIQGLKSGGKGHRLTRDIRLAGPYAVRSADNVWRRSKLQLYPAAEQTKLYQRDGERLLAVWQQMIEDATHGPVPRRLLAWGEPIHRALIDWLDPTVCRIATDDLKLHSRIGDYLRLMMPEELPLLSYRAPLHGFNLADRLNLSDLDRRLSEEKIYLSSGGYLILQQTEALYTIDVNSGADSQGRAVELRRRTNREAALAVARLLRLRNISGMVVVDFIRETNEDRAELAGYFRQALAGDRAKYKIFDFSAMGLFELIRTAL